jgi:hypothetical protein
VYWLTVFPVVVTALPEVTVAGAFVPAAFRMITPVKDLVLGFVHASVKVLVVEDSTPALVTGPSAKLPVPADPPTSART